MSMLMNSHGLRAITSSLIVKSADQVFINDDCPELLKDIVTLAKDEKKKRDVYAGLHSLSFSYKVAAPLLLNLNALESEAGRDLSFNRLVDVLGFITQPEDFLQGHVNSHVFSTIRGSRWVLPQDAAVITVLIQQLIKRAESDVAADIAVVSSGLYLLRNFLYLKEQEEEDRAAVLMQQTALRHMFMAGLKQLLLTTLKSQHFEHTFVPFVQVLQFLVIDETLFGSAASNRGSSLGGSSDKMEEEGVCENGSCNGGPHGDGDRGTGSDETHSPQSSCSSHDKREMSPDIQSSDSKGSSGSSSDGDKAGSSSYDSKDSPPSSMHNSMQKSIGYIKDSIKRELEQVRLMEHVSDAIEAIVSVPGGLSKLFNLLRLEMLKNTQSTLSPYYFLWCYSHFQNQAILMKEPVGNLLSCITVDLCDSFVFQVIRCYEASTVLSRKKDTANALTMTHQLQFALKALTVYLQSFAHIQRHWDSEEMDIDNKKIFCAIANVVANSTDLRQVFVMLLRSHDPAVHDVGVVRDVITTNHYFLELVDWVAKVEQEIWPFDLRRHLVHFADAGVVGVVARVLVRWEENAELLNEHCFNLLHHIMGDLGQPDLLLHIPLIQTFLNMWNSDASLSLAAQDVVNLTLVRFMNLSQTQPEYCQELITRSLPKPDETQPEHEGAGSDSDSSSGDDAKDMPPGCLTMEEVEIVDECLSDEQVMTLGSLTRVVDALRSNGYNRTQMQVALTLHRMGCWSTELFNDFMRVSQLAPLASKPAKVAHNLEECIEQFKLKNRREELSWLQKNLLDLLYIKLGGRHLRDCGISERLGFHAFYQDGCEGGGEAGVPLVPFLPVEQAALSNAEFQQLLKLMEVLPPAAQDHQLFPRIPKSWSAHRLHQASAALGPIDYENLPFDETNIEGQEDNVASFTVESEDDSSSMYSFEPVLAWHAKVRRINQALHDGRDMDESYPAE